MEHVLFYSNLLLALYGKYDGWASTLCNEIYKMLSYKQKKLYRIPSELGLVGTR